MGTAMVERSVEDQVQHMFALVSEGISAATAAFLADDREVARRVVADDLLLDRLQRSVEADVERRLVNGSALTPQDAGALIALLRIVPELERTGDLVEHIALRTPQGLAAEISPRCRALLEEMGRLAAEMWRIAADAYADADPSAADRLRLRDDALDDLHVSLTTQLADGDISIAVAIEMGLVARFYERLGDHAVNVARRVQGMTRFTGVEA